MAKGVGVWVADNNIWFCFGSRSSRRNLIQHGLPKGFSAVARNDRRVHPELDGQDVDLEIFKAENTNLNFYCSDEGRFALAIWGLCFDVDNGRADSAARAIFATVEKGWLTPLKDLGGLFVAMLHDRKCHSLQIFGDVLAIRPFFYLESGGALVGASRALDLARVTPGRARVSKSMLALSAYSGQEVTGGALIEGVRRLPAAQRLEWCNGAAALKALYRAYQPAEAAGTRDTAEQIYDIAKQSTRWWCGSTARVSVGLSGGFDSRLLVALLARQSDIDLKVLHVTTHSSETRAAHAVAGQLAVNLHELPASGHIWDQYGQSQLMHEMATGFPITKNLNYLLATEDSAFRLANGFLGEHIIRGYFDNVLQKKEEAYSEKDLFHGLYQYCTKNKVNNIFKTTDIGFLRELSYEELHNYFINIKMVLGRKVGSFNILTRQRNYISNNFLQNLSQHEPIIPIYDPRLVRMKLERPYSDFVPETFKTLFQLFYPQLAAIPRGDPAHEHRCKLVSQQARYLLWQLPRLELGRILNWKWLLPRLAHAGFARRFAYVPTALMKLARIEQICRDNDIALDWRF